MNLGVVTIGIIETIKDDFKQETNVQKEENQIRKLFYNGNWIDTPVIFRNNLSNQKDYFGPMIIEQIDSTVIILPGWSCKVLFNNHLLLARIQS